MDVEFSRFFTKLIKLENHECASQISTQNVIDIHLALAKRLIATEPQFEEYSVDYPDQSVVGVFGFNGKQRHYFKLQPLFRALIIIIDEPTLDPASQKVHLARTGFTSGLSAPIDFERLGNEGSDVVIVCLSDVVQFIMELERCERMAYLMAGIMMCSTRFLIL